MKRWIMSALCLGWVFFLAVYFVKPIGVSSQYSVLSGIFHTAAYEDIITEDDSRESGYKSSNAYYDKDGGKVAGEIKNPINYDFIFVVSIPLGAFICYQLNRKKSPSELPGKLEGHKTSLQPLNIFKSYIAPFIGGFILLFGARMAGGCTSGHMMSGMMQGSISGYVFAAAAFATAIPCAILLKKAGKA